MRWDPLKISVNYTKDIRYFLSFKKASFFCSNKDFLKETFLAIRVYPGCFLRLAAYVRIRTWSPILNGHCRREMTKLYIKSIFVLFFAPAADICPSVSHSTFTSIRNHGCLVLFIFFVRACDLSVSSLILSVLSCMCWEQVRREISKHYKTTWIVLSTWCLSCLLQRFH